MITQVFWNAVGKQVCFCIEPDDQKILGNNLVMLQPDGKVFLWQPKLEPEMSVTFAVVVKDRGHLSNGR